VRLERRAFLKQMADLVTTHVKCLDESGVHLGMTRRYGRSVPGERIPEATPDYSGTHYTMIAAVGLTGVSAPWIFEGAMDGLTFVAYVTTQLAPTLQPGDVVILDRLNVHFNAEAKAAVEARGARLVHLSPYSSDFNPIELVWAKVKAALRKAKARTFDALVDALAEVLRAVTEQEARACFAHCGYTVN
jgi:transposase